MKGLIGLDALLFQNAIVSGYVHTRPALSLKPDGNRRAHDGYPRYHPSDVLELSLHWGQPTDGMRNEVQWRGYIRQPIPRSSEFFLVGRNQVQMKKMQEFPPNNSSNCHIVDVAALWQGPSLIVAIPLPPTPVWTGDTIGVAVKVEMP
jgi:hypothetical protein